MGEGDKRVSPTLSQWERATGGFPQPSPNGRGKNFWNRIMSNSASFSRSWKWVALPAAAMVLLSLIPQLHLWIARGRDWNGAYVSPQGDEPLYSAYINALIDGRTRKNDPFAAKDSTPASPLPESTFSIQFAPAYVISFLARAFGASASTAMIILIGVAGSLASLSVFW